MNMHKNARLTPQGRLLLVQRVTQQGWTVTAAADAAGLSERRAYRWLARYRAGGTAALRDCSSAPRRCPHQLPAARVAAIEARRRQRLSGPAIARELGMPISTVGGVLRRLGLGKLAALDPKPPVVRYERERPGELLHIDSKKLGRIAAVGHRITGDRRDSTRGAGWEAVHVCIDDASRLAYSEVLPDERKTSAVAFLERAVAWFARLGVTVERVMTDNGSAYRSHDWRAACGALALRHLRTRPYTPRTIWASEDKPSASSRPACASGPMRAPTRPRPSAPPRWSPGSNITTPSARTPPWPTSHPPAACTHRRSSVRSPRPFLRPDLPPRTTGPPGRRQERRRRPAPAGAQRPCAAPPNRSTSTRREPNAHSPEQRSWKRQLASAALAPQPELRAGCGVSDLGRHRSLT